tara:strand:- start:954 stop:1457 length:504 start_codon:yes stop_codon:yes gene_type:complete
MNTFNRTYRTPKFFLCTHHAEEEFVGFEDSSERHAHFLFCVYGIFKIFVLDFDSNKSEMIELNSSHHKKLYDITKYLSYPIGVKMNENTRTISFNPWRKNEKWNGRLVETGVVKSNQNYSCLICYQGSVKINNQTLDEMTYCDLKKDKEYNIIVDDNSYLAFFEHEE